MDKIIAYIKEKQKEYHEGSPAYNVLRALEVELPSLFPPSQPSEQKPPERAEEILESYFPEMDEGAIKLFRVSGEYKVIISAMQEYAQSERQKARNEAIQECLKVTDAARGTWINVYEALEKLKSKTI